MPKWNQDIDGNHLQIASHQGSAMRVLAGPGTGKSYALQRKVPGKFPQKFTIEANGLPFTLVIVKVDVSLHGSDLQRRKREYESLPIGEWYKPEVQPGERFAVRLDTNSTFKHNLIPLRTDIRKKFPGYRVPFKMEYDNTTLETWVTAGKDAKVGELAGTYIARGIKPLYQDHPELKRTKEITLEVIKLGEHYKVVGYGQ